MRKSIKVSLLFGMIIIITTTITGFYLILDKKIEKKFTLINTQSQNDNAFKEEEYKKTVQKCNITAIQDAKKVFSKKWNGVKDSTDNDSLDKMMPVFPFFFLNTEIKNNFEEDKIKNTIYYPDYEQYFTICLREKGYEGN